MSEYSKTLVLADFTTADVVCTTGVWNRIGAYTVPAGVQLAVGKRFDGYVYALFDHTDSAQFHAKVRLIAADPQEFKKKVLVEFHTRNSTDAGDKTKKPYLPLKMPWLPKDYKLILEVDPEATKTLDYTGSDTVFQLDVTMKS